MASGVFLFFLSLFEMHKLRICAVPAAGADQNSALITGIRLSTNVARKEMAVTAR